MCVVELDSDFVLDIERQLFFWLIGKEMQMVLYGLEEVFCVVELGVFCVGQNFFFDQFCLVVDLVVVFGDLEQGVEVVQVVFVFFDVWFDQIL